MKLVHKKRTKDLRRKSIETIHTRIKLHELHDLAL